MPTQMQGMTAVEAAQSLGAWAANVLLRQVRGVDGQRRRTREDPPLRRDARCDLAVRVTNKGTWSWRSHGRAGGLLMLSTGPVFPAEFIKVRGPWGNRHSGRSSTGTKSIAGHSAAWEQPQLFTEEVRAAFRPLC